MKMDNLLKMTTLYRLASVGDLGLIHNVKRFSVLIFIFHTEFFS